jgi:HEAT repeat protein
MPFIKSASSAEHKSDNDIAAHLSDLCNPNAEVRWNAARALGGVAKAVPGLSVALDAEKVPQVREAMMTALMRVGDEASVRALLPYLRSQDAHQRVAAIEALQALPEAIAPFMAELLGDADADVRILATELARNMSAAEATRSLCSLLANELQPNVCAAAIEVLAEVGTRDALPTLEAWARRFSGTPFLPFAVSTAIARISSTES